MSMDFQLQTRQSQVFSPRLQHAARLLQMSSLDFATTVRDALGNNPFLEPEDGDAGGALDALVDADIESGNDGDASQAPPDALPQGGDDDREFWHADGGAAARPAGDSDRSAWDTMAVETTLAGHLHSQLNLLTLPARDLHLARVVVESLDDDGYLRSPLDDLAASSELQPHPAAAELQIALRRVQSLDPAGVGARSVGECLMLQLPAIDCERQRRLAHTIVSEHLQVLAAHDLPALARLLREPREHVEAACERIRHLDPRPGWRFGATETRYIVPDVIVKRVRGQWSVVLNPAVVPRVRVNEVYAELFQRHRSAQDAELASQLQEARWTLRNVEQRFSTIVDVAEAIVRRQRHFLEFGAMAMRPLGLREIAEEVGVHESTVSRVSNNKYMSTPGGVFELKHFFSRAMVSANGSECSGTAIRELIRDLIVAERPESPLSDVEITRQLAQQGLNIARRTVTKYRQMLRIDAVEVRRLAKSH